MDKLRLKFTKTARAVYISHLDLMRTLQRVFFRAGLPLRYSEGFNPHARISIVLPLSVGTASRCEYLDFWLTEDVPLETIPARLNASMPEGQEDIAPWIKEAEFSDGDGCVHVRAVLSAQEPTISPELFVSALGEEAPAYYRFERVKAYREDMEEFF